MQMSRNQLIEKIFSHCLGDGNPSELLLNRGKFPDNWVSRYESLVQKIENEYGGEELWPRKVVAAVHFSSFYLELRYQAWKSSTGRANLQTEGLLGSVRSVGELFLMAHTAGKEDA